jgi:hypothetical protein
LAEKLLGEPALALRGLDRLAELGLLRVLHAGLELGAAERERLRAALSVMLAGTP